MRLPSRRQISSGAVSPIGTETVNGTGGNARAWAAKRARCCACAESGTAVDGAACTVACGVRRGA